LLVGTKPNEWQKYFKDLDFGAHVLIYDYDAFEFIGPFRAVEHKNGKPIDIDAWGKKFPAQARIERAGITKQLALQTVIDLVGKANIWGHGGDKPRASVSGDTAKRLLEVFGLAWSNPSPTKPAAVTKKPPGPLQTQQSATTPMVPQATSLSHKPIANSAAEPVYKTVQGFLVRSKAEREIANLLDRFGVECHYERPIPHGGGFLCDFFLPKHAIYIEYWGLQGQAAYDTTRKAKTRVYSENGLRLLELEPADERDLESRLTQELRRFGIDIDTQEPSVRTRGWLAQLLRRIKQWLSS